MNIAIFGTKAEARFLMDKVLYAGLGMVRAFVDNDKCKQGSKIKGIPVISFTMLEEMKEELDAVIVAVRGSFSRMTILDQLQKGGFARIGIFRFSYSDYGKDIENLNDAVVWVDEIPKPIIPYIEYNVTDSCNLKCKGCAHFANLYQEDSYADCGQFNRDLERISGKAYIVQLRLLGGEPLLHPHIEQFMISAREILPHADIDVVTNGLLIPRQPEHVFKIMKENRIGFHITRYLPTEHNRGQISSILNKAKVPFIFEGEIVTKFARTLDMRGKSDTGKSQAACLSLGCRFFRDGRLYKCPMEGLIDHYTTYFGIDCGPEVRGFDIYDDDIDWKEKLDEFYREPVETCRFCAEECELFTWEVQNKPKREDWLIGGK